MESARLATDSPERKRRRGERNTALCDDAQASYCGIPREEMNRMVMDYVVGKGYRDVAEAFCLDSDTQPPVDLKSVENRMNIHRLLLDGSVHQAREKLNEMDASLLEKNRDLSFLLAKQELIELIKDGKEAEALSFASENVAPLAERDPDLLQQLEDATALLVFRDLPDSPLQHLLEPSERHRVADEVNSAILRTQQQELGSEPMLLTKASQFQYMEQELESKVHRPPRGMPSPVLIENRREDV